MKKSTLVACAALLLARLFGPGQALAVEVSGVAPGNGGDALSTTFHFNSSNTNFQMTKPDGSLLAINDMPLAYGSCFQIFNDSQDWVAKKSLQVLGADLSGFTWTSTTFPTLGTVAVDPNSGRFKFAAPTWERMGYIDGAVGGLSAFPARLVVHTDGSAICVYSQNGSGNGRIYASHYSPSAGWQTAVIIDSVDTSSPTNHATNPWIAMDATGRAICVFTQAGPSAYYRPYANVFLPGAGWQGPERIDVSQDRPAENPSIAMISGRAMCVFSQEDSSGAKRVYANEYTPANGWYGAVTIDAGNADDNSTPQVVMNSSGRAFCIYIRETATPRIHANEFVPGAGWQGFTAIDQGIATSIGSFGLAVDNSGRALCLLGLIVPGPQYQLQAVEYIPSQGWQTPLNLFTASTPFMGGSLAMNPAGAGLAAYQVSDGGNIRLYVRQYSAGAGWYAPVLADTGMASDAYDSRLVLNEQGQGLCVFRQNDGSADRIYVNHFANGSGWSGARALDAGLGLNANYPMAAMNSVGEALCTWRQYDGAKYRVDTARYQMEQPSGTVSVRYYYTPAAAPAPAKNVLTVSNRKIEPMQGGKANIRLALAQAGLVSIKIYTLQGNLVKVLSDAYLTPGNYSWDWAAGNDSGSLVASGVYLIRVKSPGIDKTQKVVVIK